jgi:hypothetical protein
MTGSTRWYDAEQLRRISEVTIAHYDRLAEAYWDGTRGHDVNQNYAALLDAIEGDPPYSILDLGCGAPMHSNSLTPMQISETPRSFLNIGWPLLDIDSARCDWREVWTGCRLGEGSD